MLLPQTVAREFRDALRPLIRRLNNERTMSLGKAGVLAHLSEHGRATASELAAAERVSPQAITIAVRELEGLKLVERTPDGVDRRRIWVQLTDEGRRRLEEEYAAGHSWFAEAIGTRLSDDERAILLAAVPVLRKVASGRAVD